jgi:hypothetical protein
MPNSLPDLRKLPGVHIKITPEQKNEIAKLVSETANARLLVFVSYEADMKSGTLAPSTFLVGTAE